MSSMAEIVEDFRTEREWSRRVELVALVVFLEVVLPVNPRFPVHGSGAVPAGWETLRARLRRT